MDMEEIKRYFDEKISKLTKRADDSARQKPLNMKNKGNQAQHDHAANLLDLIKSADDSVKEEDTNGARQSLKKAKKELEKRIKLIRLADKSEHGWATVNEYLSDELASDSEDEKRMRRAESQAAAKRKRNLQRHQFQQQELNPPKKLKPVSDGQEANGPATNKRFFRSSREFQYNDKCFGCGRTGHWRVHCPNYDKGHSSGLSMLSHKSEKM